MNETTITGLFIYPVKSMGGIAVEQATLTARGLLDDRRWMVVQENDHFATQRDFPQLALIRTALDKEGLLLSMQGMDSLQVPYDLYQGEIVNTSVWGASCRTIDQGKQVSQWLTKALGTDHAIRLVRMDPAYTRPQMKADLLGADTSTDFADAAPFLVANEASLVQLNAVLKSNQLDAVPMNRFRPNIIIQGIEPFAEHKLTGLHSDTYALDLCYPCERCIVTTIDQQTAQKDPAKQPFKTLQNINPMSNKKSGPAFGENATLSSGEGKRISVGDNLQAIFGRS